MYDQFVITSILKDEGEELSRSIRLVTNNREEAEEFNVSAYVETPWNVWLEHFIINEKFEVIRRQETKIIYPPQD
jgi:hypothetical protein